MFSLIDSASDFLKLITMQNKEIDLQVFWKSVFDYRDKLTPNPTYISVYKAKKDYKLTPQAITKAVNDGLVRQNEEQQVAQEDVAIMKTFVDFFEDLKKTEIVKEADIFGKKKLMVVDTFKHGESLTKYQTEIMAKIVLWFQTNLYDFVPKNLPLEEKIKLLSTNQ